MAEEIVHRWRMGLGLTKNRAPAMRPIQCDQFNGLSHSVGSVELGLRAFKCDVALRLHVWDSHTMGGLSSWGYGLPHIMWLLELGLSTPKHGMTPSVGGSCSHKLYSPSKVYNEMPHFVSPLELRLCIPTHCGAP